MQWEGRHKGAEGNTEYRKKNVSGSMQVVKEACEARGKSDECKIAGRQAGTRLLGS